MKFCIVLLVSVASFDLVVAQGTPEARIDSLLHAAGQIGVFNGNALVAQNGRIIYQGAVGFADAGKTKPLTIELRFGIGSISKEFNSVGIMVLGERGKLTLEDSISKYIVGLPSWAGRVRIKHLLQYTSGLPQTLSDSGLGEALMNLKQLAFEPGTVYIYSNYNIYLQIKIIEKITGLTYAQFIETTFFKPLSMRETRFGSFRTMTGMARPFDNNFVETPNLDQADGPFTTAGDLYKWAFALQAGKIINRHSLEELSASFGQNESSLGFAQFEQGVLAEHVHQGSGYNYEGLLYSSDTSKITIILLTSSQEFKVQELKDALLNILQDKPYQVPKKSVYLDLRTRVLENFDKGIAFFEDIKLNGRDKYEFSNVEIDLYNTAKYLMRRNRFDDAIKILHLSTMENLQHTGGMSFAFTLIGECYLKKDEKEMAIIYYKKAVELDPTNKNAIGVLKSLY